MANVRRVAEVLLRVRSRGLLCHSLHLGIATDALGSLRRVSGSRTLVTVVPPAFGACIDGSGHLPCSVAYLTGLCTTEGTPRIVAPGLFCLSLGCHLLIGHNIEFEARALASRHRTLVGHLPPSTIEIPTVQHQHDADGIGR